MDEELRRARASSSPAANARTAARPASGRLATPGRLAKTVALRILDRLAVQARVRARSGAGARPHDDAFRSSSRRHVRPASAQARALRRRTNVGVMPAPDDDARSAGFSLTTIRGRRARRRMARAPRPAVPRRRSDVRARLSTWLDGARRRSAAVRRRVAAAVAAAPTSTVVRERSLLFIDLETTASPAAPARTRFSSAAAGSLAGRSGSGSSCCRASPRSARCSKPSPKWRRRPARS